MNSKTKNREGVSDLNTDPKYPKSTLTDSDREKADVFFQVFYYSQMVISRHTMEELNISEEMIFF